MERSNKILIQVTQKRRHSMLCLEYVRHSVAQQKPKLLNELRHASVSPKS